MWRDSNPGCLLQGAAPLHISMVPQLAWLWDSAALQYLRSVSDTSILYAVIVFSVVIYLWEEYLSIRQVSTDRGGGM